MSYKENLENQISKARNILLTESKGKVNKNVIEFMENAARHKLDEIERDENLEYEQFIGEEDNDR